MKTGIIVLVAAVGGAALFAFFAPRSESQSHPPTVSAAAEPSAPTPGSTQPAALSGTVTEVIQVPGYTYLALDQGGATRWAAVSTMEIEKGTAVSVRIDTELTNFKSSTLNRTFDSIVFGTFTEGSGATPAPANPHAGLDNGNPHAGVPMGQNAPIKIAQVAKAKGGYSIEEIYAKRQELAGKTVRVRGVVTKALDGIMGLTFAHLGDGTGTAEAKNNDLTVTMLETPGLGDEVTIEGTLVLNKDVGAGYKYDVIVEQAKLVSE